ncbi:hypothetical protein HPB51_006603 [Rhipicephalus microplus]|uniref:Uncharacterized protein n=1 Tax=Rhipicephalus microplus TaxID=6941 RepID=A0A9J6E6E7_RHIMP|nr:hypothetical protein HPB51_006603 [Rhipicephalus microplus]
MLWDCARNPQGAKSGTLRPRLAAALYSPSLGDQLWAIQQAREMAVKRKRPDPKSRDFPAPPGPECSGLCDLPGAENFPEDSPTKQFYKDKVLSSQEEITQLKKKVKTLQQTKRRLVKRNESAQEIIKEIREQKLLSEEGSHVFSSVFSDDIQQLLCRVGNEQKGKYPPELRAFALTLQFYSPAAYEYVRSKFNEALPSQRTLRGWYKSIQGAPGFTAEAFAFLEKFAEARDEPFYCALIVDDMAIRKHVELVGDKVVGYVDFGTGLDDDGLPEAANACVFMIVGINVRFKMSVGYFLIDSLTGAERAELAKQCIEKLALFMAAYKRLLVQTEVTSSSSGSCTKDMVSILNATTVVAQVDATSALTDMRRSSILEPHDDHDYTHPENLSAVVVAVVPYNAGFVVRQVCKTTTCEECIAALYSDELVPLVEQKNRGGLVSPSKDVIGLCEAVEKGLRRLQIECGTLQAVNSQSKHLVLEVLRLSVEEKWFQKLEQHILDLDPLDNHIYSLCKKVAELYVKIRIHHMTKERNREIIKDRVRPVLSRMIIFKHQ